MVNTRRSVREESVDGSQRERSDSSSSHELGQGEVNVTSHHEQSDQQDNTLLESNSSGENHDYVTRDDLRQAMTEFLSESVKDMIAEIRKSLISVKDSNDGSVDGRASTRSQEQSPASRHGVTGENSTPGNSLSERFGRHSFDNEGRKVSYKDFKHQNFDPDEDRYKSYPDKGWYAFSKSFESQIHGFEVAKNLRLYARERAYLLLKHMTGKARQWIVKNQKQVMEMSYEEIQDGYRAYLLGGMSEESLHRRLTNHKKGSDQPIDEYLFDLECLASCLEGGLKGNWKLVYNTLLYHGPEETDKAAVNVTFRAPPQDYEKGSLDLVQCLLDMQKTNTHKKKTSVPKTNTKNKPNFKKRKISDDNKSNQKEANSVEMKGGARFKDTTCDFCNKKGHTAAYHLRQLKSGQWKPSNDFEREYIKRATGGSWSRQGEAYSSEKKVRIQEDKNKSQYDFELNLVEANEVYDEGIISDWGVDSCASVHMTGYQELLKNVRPAPLMRVRVANGKRHMSIKVGDIELQVEGKTYSIKNVRYVPQLRRNLLSVNQLAARSGILAKFGPKEAELYNQHGEVVLRAQAVNGIYLIKPDQAEVALAVVKKDTAENWHRRLGHTNQATVLKAVDQQGDMTVLGKRTLTECETCIKAKIRRSTIAQHRTRPEEDTQRTFVADVVGKLKRSRTGKEYLAFGKLNGLCFTMPVKTKDQATQAVKFWIQHTINRYGPHLIVTFRTDGGGELDNPEIQNFVMSHGISFEKTIPDTPHQNGIAERGHHIAMQMTRAMLQDAGLGYWFWEDAFPYACEILSSLPRKEIGDRSGQEAVTGEKSDISKFYTFGAHCVFRNPKPAHKLVPRGLPGRFLGYSTNQKGMKMWDTTNNKIVVTKDVIFLNGRKMESLTEEMELWEEDPLEEIEVMDLWERDTPEDSEQQDMINDDNVMDEIEERESEGRLPLRRSKRIAERNNQMTLVEAYIAAEELSDDPKSIREALARPDAIKWKEAIQAEMNSLMKNGTFERVERPKDKNVISCKWVLKVKRNSDNTINKYKARLVARGFTQKLHEDYNETYAPVASKTTFRLFLAISARFGWTIDQYDVPSAYVQATLDGEELYMEMPKGYKGHENKLGEVQPEKRAGKDDVLKLIKGLYGLKQSGMCWNKEINKTLMELNLKPVLRDRCLYFTKNEDGKYIILLLYVDDVLIAGNWVSKKDEVLSTLKTKYDIKGLGGINQFLGMQVIQYNDGSSVINQRKYIESMLEQFKLQDCIGRHTPMQKGEMVIVDPSDEAFDKTRYKQAIGSLLYLCTCSRPDITYAVGQVSRACEAPTQQNWDQVTKIMQYLQRTKNLGLHFYFDRTITDIVDVVTGLNVFTDADWANDTNTRKSISGIFIKLWGCPIAWSSKRQTIVAMSTCVAEIVAACSGVQEAERLRELIQEIELANTTYCNRPTIYVDNKPAINLLSNDKPPQTSKHLSIRWFFLRDKVLAGDYKIRYCQSKDQVADIFTKSLGRSDFERLRKLIMVKNASKVKF